MINLIIILSVLCSSLAQIALKQGMMQCNCSFVLELSNVVPLLTKLVLNPYIVLGVTLHVVALFTWLYVLKHVDVSYAYPFISMGFIVVLMLSYFLFSESINGYRIAGVGFIVFGILLVSKSAVH
jgi:drug/metabolite transporter (DMT)-like permease